ncbi:MAG: CPBP family intramembrane metalloprotease [Gemmataceae bacterium]|nr:CPBP family intramembrane metalloprotease [Gemmataceae bacterium]
MEKRDTQDSWAAIHGGLFLVLMPLLLLLGPALGIPALARWPWYFLAPLLGYALVVGAIAPLRHSVHWLRVGRLDARVLLATAGIVVLSSTALILYFVAFRPDLRALAEQLPVRSVMPVILAGALFALSNALMEEIIFRGILQDALTSQLGERTAILVQAVVFGLGHMRGYPPGEIGMVLAGIYGLMLGVVRAWTGGLGATFIAHVFADATIFWIVCEHV